MNRNSATKRPITKAGRNERTRKASNRKAPSRKASSRKAAARVAQKPEQKKDIQITGLAIAQISASLSASLSASPASAGEGKISAVAQIGSAMRAHKFRVGQTVFYTSSPISRPGASGSYKVVRLLPSDGEDYQYRIKHAGEAFERVAKESQLELES
jgi:hypothetical protein